MKTAALILGIAGGMLALFLGYMNFMIGLGIAQYGTAISTQENTEPDPIEPSDYPFLAPGLIGMAGGAAGIAGGAFVLRRKSLAGSLMTAGACLSLPSIIGIIASVPLFIGGIFMFIRACRKATSPFKPLSVTLAYCGAAMALAAAILKYLSADESLLIAASAAGASLLVFGAALAAKNRVIPGIFMAAAAVACIIGESGILAVLLSVAAAAFILIPGKRPVLQVEETR